MQPLRNRMRDEVHTGVRRRFGAVLVANILRRALQRRLNHRVVAENRVHRGVDPQT